MEAECRAKTKAPKLPNLNDKDNVDAYLDRFERYATNHKWKQSDWAENLSNLLTGKALEVYYRLDPSEAIDYQALKTALLRRFDYTIDGFLHKFRNSPADEGESPVEYLIRLGTCLDKWVDLCKVPRSYKALRDLIVREQFLNVCDKDVSLYLNREADLGLCNFGEKALTYLQSAKRKFKVNLKTMGDGKTINNKSDSKIQCHHCHVYGHKRPDCPKRKSYNNRNSNSFDRSYTKRSEDTYTRSKLKCFLCDGSGHKAEDCKKFTSKVVAMLQEDHNSSGTDNSEITCLCMGDRCIADMCVNVITPIATGIADKTRSTDELPTANGMVGNQMVEMLRDSGCTGVVVKQDLVRNDQFTGEIMKCKLIDRTVLHVPTAEIEIDTPYYSGKVTAMCIKTPIYDLVVGEIPGARPPGKPDSNWKSLSSKVQSMDCRTSRS